MENNTLNKVHTTKDFIIFTILLAAGAGLYLLNAGLGVTIGICAFATLIFRSGYREKGRGPTLKKRSIDIATTVRQEWKDYLEGKNVEIRIVHPKDESGAMLLEVYYNKHSRVAFAQLYDYANYSYEKATEMVRLEGDRAEKIIRLLESE